MSDHLKRAHNPFDDPVDEGDENRRRPETPGIPIIENPPDARPPDAPRVRRPPPPQFIRAKLILCVVGVIVFGYNAYRYVVVEAESLALAEHVRGSLDRTEEADKQLPWWQQRDRASVGASMKDFDHDRRSYVRFSEALAIAGMVVGLLMLAPALASVLHAWFTESPVSVIVVLQVLFWIVALVWLFVGHRAEFTSADGTGSPVIKMVFKFPGFLQTLLVCLLWSALLWATSTTWDRKRTRGSQPG
jgi:hypothetical protein